MSGVGRNHPCPCGSGKKFKKCCLSAASAPSDAYYDKHYRGWVDTPLPALRGQTPREAAGSKDGRPRVVALLKDMDSRSARQRLDGHLACDLGWMWGELGLDRPG
jgi:SEC-C motif/Protein of unknown function (DUF2384)